MQKEFSNLANNCIISRTGRPDADLHPNRDLYEGVDEHADDAPDEHTYAAADEHNHAAPHEHADSTPDEHTHSPADGYADATPDFHARAERDTAATLTPPTTVSCGNTVQVNETRTRLEQLGQRHFVHRRHQPRRLPDRQLPGFYAEVASGQIRCAIYNNNPDPNKALLCESAPVTAVPGGTQYPSPAPPSPRAHRSGSPKRLVLDVPLTVSTTGVCN